MAVQLMRERLMVVKPYPNLDYSYGPYSSVAEAFEAVGPDGDDIAAVGLTVGIQTDPNGPVVEYWFKEACEEETDLVKKEPDLTGYVQDANYVHTDNNYTTAEKTKLAGLENYDDTVITASLANKVDKVSGKGLSSEDYTTIEKTKLGGIQANAEVNVISSVKVNNVALTPDQNKAVNVLVPTNVSDLTNDSGFVTNSVNNLTNYYNKTEIDSKVSAVYRYKGSVNTYSDLPSIDLTVGDVYNIVTDDPTHGILSGDNVAWTGTQWDKLGGDIDLSVYYTSSQVDNLLDDKVDKVVGKQLSTEDYTTAEQTKLSGIETGAEVNIIEEVMVNNVPLVPDANKSVNIDITGKLDAPSSEGTNGQVLTTDGSGGRSWTTIATGATDLDSLTDVDITLASDGQALVYDSVNSKWVNGQAGDTNVIEVVKVDGTALVPDVNKAVNVDLSGKVNEPATEGNNGQFLTTDGNGARNWSSLYFSLSNENATLHID